MAQIPELNFSKFVAKKKEERGNDGGIPRGSRDYAYVSDRQTRKAFESAKPVEVVVSSTVRMFRHVWRNQLLGQSVKVSERQLPRIHALAMRCTDALGLESVPNIYIVNSPVLNAATYGTEEESFILLNSALIDHYSDDELLAVIGHECGHIHNHHVVYLTALHYLTQMASVFVRWAIEPASFALRAWSRRAEITCDRAAMLCTRNEISAQRALTKLALGSHKLYDEFNLEAFLEQNEESKGGIGHTMEMFQSHPWLPKRVLAMRAFAKSERYRTAAGLGSDGITIEEVDREVGLLL